MYMAPVILAGPLFFCREMEMPKTSKKLNASVKAKASGGGKAKASAKAKVSGGGKAKSKAKAKPKTTKASKAQPKPVMESWSAKYKKSDTRVRFIAATMALWASYHRLDSERSISSKAIKGRLGDALKGKFLWELVTLVLVKVKSTGLVYVLNGSHTLKMMFSAHFNKFYPTMRVLTYEAPNIETAKKLWIDIDQGLRRTKKHRVNGLLMGTRGFEAAVTSKTMINDLQNGLNWLLGGGQIKFDLPVEMIFDLLSYGGKYHSTAMKVKEILGMKAPRRTIRPGSVAAMLDTFDADPKNAAAFWKEVRCGESDDEICQILHNNLCKLVIPNNRNMVTEGLAGTMQIQASNEQIYRMCIELWNCWCTGTLPHELEVIIKLVTAAPARAKVKVRVGTRRRNKVLKKWGRTDGEEEEEQRTKETY